MNLDDVKRMRSLDPEDMLGKIEELPGQLEEAWAMGQSLPLEGIGAIERVVVAGMGGSAIGADLLRAYSAPTLTVPFEVWRNYGLPAYAAGPSTLVVLSSHSGNTEEVLSALDEALDRNTNVLGLTCGGELGKRGGTHGFPVWRFKHDGQPRAATGFSFGLLLAALNRLGLLPDPSGDVQDAVTAMRTQQETLHPDIPVTSNPAKRMAGQLMERWPVFLGAGLLEPVARRWRTQLAELAKAFAQFEGLPEADHNMLAGILQPECLFPCTMTVFLEASLEHPRNALRAKLSREILMMEGINTDFFRAPGKTRLAQQWTALHFGDYVAYYLAMAYGVDPTPIPAIQELKERMQEIK